MTQDNSVVIATGYGMDGQNSILVRVRNCFLLHSFRAYFPEGKAAGA
jgi:hypothetical protein